MSPSARQYFKARALCGSLDCQRDRLSRREGFPLLRAGSTTLISAILRIRKASTKYPVTLVFRPLRTEYRLVALQRLPEVRNCGQLIIAKETNRPGFSLRRGRKCTSFRSCSASAPDARGSQASAVGLELATDGSLLSIEGLAYTKPPGFLEQNS